MNHTSERLMSRRVILFLILGMVFVFSLSGAAAVRADFTNAPGSSLTYSRTEDGGVSVTMKAADNWNISPDRLIWDKTFSTDDTVEVYVAPDCFNNGALHYLVIRLADKGSDTYVYELHVGNQGTGNFNLRSSVNIWTDFAASQTGIAHLTFRIGENGLETIYEGNVIETISSFTAENFPNGIEISFRAYAEAMWGGSGADLTSYIRVDNPKAIDAEKVFFLTQDEDLSYAIDLNGATATAVTLNRNGETAVVLDPDDYVLTDVLLTLTATGLKKAISDAGDYTITIENPAKNISLHMRVSGVESLQPESTKHVYDRYSGGDLSFTVWNNKDTYLRLLDENNVEVVGVNYNSINNMLIIPESYLQGLTSGTHNFRIVSEMLPDGVAFSVAISNSAPPLYEGVALNFDRYQPQDLVFSVSLFENDSIWLEGNGIESSDFSAIGETVTIFSSFFAGVEPGVLTIYLCGENGKTSLEIAITDSEPAVLISDDTAQINLLSISDAEFGFEMKYDEILSVTGNGITEGDWTVNDKDDLIILRTFISSALATEGSYSFDVLSKNGGEFCLTIVTDKMSPPTIEGENRATFSKNASAEVSFQVALNDSEFLGISGGGITGGNYTTDIHEGILKLTFSENFLLGLTNGRHTFSLRFTNGEILVEIAVENTFIPEFENGEVFLFAESNGDDLTVGLEARYGVLLTAEGLGENDFVYDSVKSTLTILADFLREVDESTELKFVFDNGNATLIVEIPYQTDILETYEPAWVSGAPDGSVRLSGREDGWVNVEYLTPTAGAYGGGIKIRTPFRAERPVEIYVDFGSVPDLAGTSFALTLSSDAHKMHYGIDPCDLFGSFGVGDDFLQSGYFGKPGVHDALDQQISHELMRRSESGYETFTFDIGESGTKIYLNGRLIREVADVTRSVFANGDVYVLFTPLFWHDQEGTDFMIKSNAPVQVEETSYRLNKKTMAPVVIHANIRGLFEGIALFDGEEEIEISTFRYERDILNGNTEISIPAESILYRRGFSADKEYWLRVKTSTGNIDAPLVLSDAEHLEIITEALYFDLSLPEDLTIRYLENFDVFEKIEGEGITAEDYSAANGVLNIGRTFLEKFPIGKIKLTVFSERKNEGQSLEIAIVDSSPAKIEGDKLIFDLNNEQDLSVGVIVETGHALSLHGYGLTAEDWSIEDQTLTIEKEYLSTLTAGSYIFELRDEWLTGRYNSIDLKVTVVNSVPPTFADGSKEQEIEYIIGTDKDVTVSLNANKGLFLEAVGGYLTADLYEYNASAGTLTLYAEWFATMKNDAFDVELRFDNGTVTLYLTVQESAVPGEDKENPPENKGCGNIGLGGTAGLSGGILLLAATIFFVNKRQAEEEMDL